MNVKNIVTATCLVVCISLTIDSVSGLTCRTCENVRCASPESLKCTYGAVEVKCGCCYECRKGKGEECGGSYDIFGTCAENLICVGGYIWLEPGQCKTPEQVETDKTYTAPPGAGTTTTRPPWFQG